MSENNVNGIIGADVATTTGIVGATIAIGQYIVNDYVITITEAEGDYGYTMTITKGTQTQTVTLYGLTPAQYDAMLGYLEQAQAAAQSAQSAAESAGESETAAREFERVAGISASSASSAKTAAQSAASNARSAASDAASAKNDAVTAKNAAEAAATRAEAAAGQITGMTAEAETLEPGSSATASFLDGVLSLGIPAGAPGADGDDGNGIVSIVKTGTSGNVDTYTITYTNGTTSAFTVTNGVDGAVTSVAGKTGAVTLNAGDVAFDDQQTYDDGTVGAGLTNLKSHFDHITDPTQGNITISGPTTGFWDLDGTTFYLKSSAYSWHCVYSNKIPCVAGDKFSYRSANKGGNVAYFSDINTCTSLEELNAGINHIITIPSGCKYIMFQDRAVASSAVSITAERITPVTYDVVTGTAQDIETGLVWTKGAYSGEWVETVSVDDVELLKYLSGIDSKYIEIESAKNRYFYVSNGTMLVNESTSLYTKVTNRIKCEPGFKFSYSGTSNSVAPCAFFFADATTNELIDSTHSVSDVTIPDGAHYVMFQSYSTTSTVSIDVALVEPAKIGSAKPLKGLKWAAIGDSITALRTNVVVWATLFAQNDLVNMTNMGIGNTGFKATSGNNDNYISRISSIPNDVELITVSGSFNDLYQGYTLGTIDDADDSTIAGCMNLFFTALLAAFPTVPIGIYTTGPWGQYHSGVTSSDNYVDMLRRMGLKYGIPFYSIYDQTNLRPWNDSNKTFYFGSDAIHPNSEGHKLMYAAYKPFIERLVYPKQI